MIPVQTSSSEITMIPVNITLQYLRDGVKDSRRLKLALDQQTHNVVAQLIRELQLPTQNGEDNLSYYLLRQRQVIDNESTLFEAGVQEGDILQLAVIDPNATVGKALSGSVLNRLGGKTSTEPLPVSAALFTASGQRFVLKHTRALIGRSDINLGYP